MERKKLNRFAVLIAPLLWVGICESQIKSVVIGNDDFNSQSLLSPENRSSSFSFLNPNRFSMRQSYSLSYAAGGYGSSSSGVYLNTLSYQLANPLTLSFDMGFYTPLYSSFPGSGQKPGFSQGVGTSLILPRIGLEYKPSDHFSMNLELVNGRDAWKAYGSPFYNPDLGRSR